MSHPRGGRNGAAWITCLQCGSRWERCWESQDVSPSEQSVAAATARAVAAVSGSTSPLPMVQGSGSSPQPSAAPTPKVTSKAPPPSGSTALVQVPGPVVVPGPAPVPSPGQAPETPVQAALPTIQEEEFVHVEPETPMLSMMQLAEQKYHALRQTMEHEAVTSKRCCRSRITTNQLLMQFITAHFPPTA